ADFRGPRPPGSPRCAEIPHRSILSACSPTPLTKLREGLFPGDSVAARAVHDVAEGAAREVAGEIVVEDGRDLLGGARSRHVRGDDELLHAPERVGRGPGVG